MTNWKNVKRLSPLALYVLACATIGVACATGEEIDGGPVYDTFGTGTGSGTDGDTDSSFEEGGWWCSDAPNAFWYDSMGVPHQLQGVVGCDCAPSELDDQLEAKLVNGQALVTDSDNSDLVLFRNSVYQFGQADCLDHLDPEPQDYQSDNCLEDTPTPFFIYDQDTATPGLQPTALYPDGECSFQRKVEELPGGCSFVDGAYGITYSVSTATYTIPQATWDDFFGRPSCLLLEGGRVDSDGSGGYKLTGVDRGTLLYELGLRSNDVFVEIDQMSLGDINAAFDAFDALKNQTSWTVKLRRGGSPLTLNYVVN